VSTAAAAAAALVAYDGDVARRLLARVVEELDGPSLGDPVDVERARAFLSSSDARDPSGRDLTTREWKVGFARRERMRSLGVELARLLG
jgi:hypothetical protein